MTRTEQVTEACCQLWHPGSETRQCAAARLAQLDDRSALIHLERALVREADDGARVAIEAAITRLTHETHAPHDAAWREYR